MGTSEHPASRFVLVITEKGYGKRVPIEEFSKKSRGLMGIIAIKFKSKVCCRFMPFIIASSCI